MSRAIITYAEGAHEELLEVALPTYKDFAHRHGYDLLTGGTLTTLPPAWNKIPLLMGVLETYDEVVWFDSDLVVVNPEEDFPPFMDDTLHSLVRHFAWDSEVPNSGVWRMRRVPRKGDFWMLDLLREILALPVFTNHGWWEQAALMTLMGYTVPPEGSDFRETRCRCVNRTKWYNNCRFMRLCWNSHPNYRSDKPRIIHCSYTDMQQRLEVMRALVRDPHYNYPRYNVVEEKLDDQTDTKGDDK